jgi:hypothetical protein
LINQSDNHPSSPRNSPSGTPTFPTTPELHPFHQFNRQLQIARNEKQTSEPQKQTSEPQRHYRSAAGDTEEKKVAWFDSRAGFHTLAPVLLK